MPYSGYLSSLAWRAPVTSNDYHRLGPSTCFIDTNSESSYHIHFLDRRLGLEGLQDLSKDNLLGRVGIGIQFQLCLSPKLLLSSIPSALPELKLAGIKQNLNREDF